jgi:hypothetical protein
MSLGRTERMVCVMVEITGICGVCVGIGIELAYKADIGYIAITSGSLILAIGGLVFAKIR